MLASLNFIEKFISLPKKNHDVVVNGKTVTKTIFDTTHIAPILTKQGFEVEKIRQFCGEFDSVVVGRIEHVTKHPEATRLNVCMVNINENTENLRQIVCGAQNVTVGMYVAVALPGTQLPVISKADPVKEIDVSQNPITFEIKSSFIRNIKSDGMLCARSELGLSINPDVDGDGIWDLTDDAQGGMPVECLAQKLGYPVFMTLGLEDTLLELSVTPNRPDMLCQQGVARELAAGFRYNQIPYEVKNFSFLKQSGISEIHVRDDASQNSQGQCGTVYFEAYNYLESTTAFFVLIELTRSQVKTPGWLRNLLEPLNQNSINLVVDISNFILVAYAQPNHAFDLDALDAENATHKKLVLRHAKPEETFVSLDGKERKLHEKDCIVSDSTIPQALLGVVGGEYSKITLNTHKIVVEFANPNQALIRHTARRHDKQTVASFMFEKGIDVASRFRAAAEFLALLEHITPAKYCTSLHSKNLENLPVIQTSFPSVWLPLSACDQKNILGTDLISFSMQIEILHSLGFSIKNENDFTLVNVPSWRQNDVVDTPDLVEEFIRVVGIDIIPPVPIEIIATVNNDDAHLPVIQMISNQLCSVGYHEVRGLNFMRSDDYQKLNLSSANALGVPVTILNPVLGDEPFMQTTLVPDLLRKINRNLSYGIKAGQLFLSERTFYQSEKHLDPVETHRFAGVCFGLKDQKTWQNQEPKGWSIHDVMMHMSTIVEPLNLQLNFELMAHNNPFLSSLHPKKRVDIYAMNQSGKVHIGWVGELHPKVQRNYEIDTVDVYVFELNFKHVFQAYLGVGEVKRARYTPPKFPLLSRDFSFILDKDISAKKIEQCIQNALSETLKTVLYASVKDIQIFDVYYGDNIGEQNKSVTFRVILEPQKKTFTENEILIFSNCVSDAIKMQLAGKQRI